MIHMNIRNITLSDSISICEYSDDPTARDASQILQRCSCSTLPPCGETLEYLQELHKSSFRPQPQAGLIAHLVSRATIPLERHHLSQK